MPHPRKLTSKTTDPPWRAAARQTRVAHRTPGATPHQPHAHTRRNEISRSGGAPPHSDFLPADDLGSEEGAGTQRDLICIYIGVRGLATGTAYFIPARVGVWLVGGASRGPAGRLGFVAPRRRRAAPLAMGGRCFSKYVSGDGAYTDVFS